MRRKKVMIFAIAAMLTLSAGDKERRRAICCIQF